MTGAPEKPATQVALEATLRARDDDPAFASAPCMDVYARISQDQDDNWEKTDRQVMDGLRLVESRPWRLGKVLADNNVSAWKLRSAPRPRWKELCERLSTGQADGVCVWHLDRLLRQPRDLEHLIDLAKAGYRVASCHGEFDLGDDGDRFVVRVQTASAVRESDALSRRQMRKMQERRDKGLLAPGARAFGFGGNGPDKQPVPDEQVEAEREAIRWGCQAVLDGVSMKGIAEEWNRRGLRSARWGNEFDLAAVRAVLLRARNAGLVEHKGKTVARAADVEPIIDEDTFDAVRSTFAARRRGRPPTARYLLSGLLRCGVCGYGLTGFVQSGGRGRYSCRHARGCAKISIDMARTDEAVRRLWLRTMRNPKHKTQVARRSKAVDDLNASIAKAEEKAREVGRRFGEEDMEFDQYDAIIGPLDRRLKEMRAKRDALLAQGGTDTATAHATEQELKTRWGSPDDLNYATPERVEQRRVLVRQAFPAGLLVAPATRVGTFDETRITPL
jgi:site-specific DNA recombinase